MTNQLGSLCIHSNTVNGDTNIVDSSDNNVAITNYGVTHSTEQAKFGASSLYFNGNIAMSNPPQVGLRVSDFLDLPTKDFFTIDFWIFPQHSSNHSAIHSIFSNGNQGFDGAYNLKGFNIAYIIGVSYFNFFFCLGHSQIKFSTPHNLLLNQWYHVAIVKTGNGLVSNSNIKIAINGVFQTLTISNPGLNTYTNSGLSSCTIGNSYSGYYSTHGYIDEFHIDDTQALWTADFTPPTSPYSDADVVLVSGDYGYLCIQSPDGSIDGDITMKDSSPNNHTIANIGDIPAKHSTDIALFGSSSIYCVGNNSTISVEFKKTLYDWSFDAWVYFDSSVLSQRIFHEPSKGGLYNGHKLTTNNDGNLVFTTEWVIFGQNDYQNRAGAQTIIYSQPLEPDTWYHVYAARKSSYKRGVPSYGTIQGTSVIITDPVPAEYTVDMYLAVNGIMETKRAFLDTIYAVNAQGVSDVKNEFESTFKTIMISPYNDLNIALEEIRVCNYLPYTTDFIVPNSPYGTVVDDNAYYITVNITQGGTGVERTVRLYNRETGVLIEEKQSNAQGIVAFTDLTGIDESTECQLIVVDDNSNVPNTDIIRRIYPCLEIA